MRISDWSSDVCSSDRGRGPGGVPSETALASFHELLRPGVIQALRDPFLAAQLRNAVFAAQPIENNAYLVLGREVPPCRTPDILHQPLSRGLYRRFFQGGFGLHLRSFVTTTKPKPSLNHNLKSVPLVLTADTRSEEHTSELQSLMRISYAAS